MKTAGQDRRHGQHTPTPEGSSTVFVLPTASVSFSTDIQKDPDFVLGPTKQNFVL